MPEPFDTLYHSRFLFHTRAEWDAYFADMAVYLDTDPRTRARCLERLCTAAFWVEGRGPKKERPEGLDRDARVRWLLDLFLATHEKHPDTLPSVLGIMRYKVPHGAVLSIVLDWLGALLKAPPKGVRLDVLKATILLNAPLSDEDVQQTIDRWITLLDDPSDYLRACAAYRFGGCYDEGDMTQEHAFALIKQKDIERPGVAGPFWTEAEYGIEDKDFAIEWMMQILEARTAPVPDDIPFNDIEFHLHEISSHAPDTVRRMLDGGHKALAVETALETRGVVPGMAPILRELGTDLDFGHFVIRHLAYFYQEVHPSASVRDVKRHADWRDGADLFLIRFFEQSTDFDCAVIYCTADSGVWTEPACWALVDQLIPPERRGLMRSGPMAFDKSLPPRPDIVGATCTYHYENRTSVCFEGNPAQQTYARIALHGLDLSLADI